ncbi:alpha/beta fold hydrolase [Fodinicurvata halophila]|uniref:Alpha/beta fold hydrolase n=1 Tax=Fodinicurvata halophila TaxID=1419723 RepID=A0ABV8UIH3_9PROT
MTPTSKDDMPHDAEVGQILSPTGLEVSYHRYGSGPPLVLVHGSFTDHITNWQFVAPVLAREFTVYSVARRGRGGTTATQGHSVQEEAEDVAALLKAIGKSAFLLGHSYGAHIALMAAAEAEQGARRLVLYEPPWPHIIKKDVLARLEELARDGDWDGFAVTFHRDILFLPAEELDALRATDLWPLIVANASPSLHDLRAGHSYMFDAAHFRELQTPVILQVGTESPRDFFVTDALAAVLPRVRVEELPGQGHEAMMSAPEQYARAVSRSLLSDT